MEKAPIKNNKPPMVPNKKPITAAALRIAEARQKYRDVGRNPHHTPLMSGKGSSQQRSRTVERTSTNEHVSIANPDIGYVASCLGPIIITAPHSCRLIKA